MKPMKPRYLYALVFVLGVACMFVAQQAWSAFAPCHQAYDLLNPTRRCGNALAQGEWNFETLRDDLSAKKEQWKTAGDVTHLSIYFQDLDHGPRFGIGEYDKFHPASLMKLPVMIFFLHAADLEPGILDKTYSYTDTPDVTENVTKPEETIEPGKPYPVRELLRKMIVYSDNRSYAVLLREMNALSQDTAYYTFRDLDVLQMMLESKETYVSISSYAKLFAVLYNTGYLSKDMSQFALELLSSTTFHEGIEAGVPTGLRVAHKFGYAVVEGENQLHDCGIVYHPKMAYVLCVMTSGTDQNRMNDVIVRTSKTVYDTVSKLDSDDTSNRQLTKPL